VNDALRRHLRAGNLVVVMVTQDAAGQMERLLSGSPTPIHYDAAETPASVLAEDRRIESFPVKVNRERSHIVSPQDLFDE
jgi:hypothetical protein